jgi:NADH dehydrogenase FAD-containing subunit
MNPKRILIMGGGFAGVALAQNAERHLKSSVEIVVISRDNRLVFSPLLPEVAARGVSFMHFAVPGRTTTRRTRWMQAGLGLQLENGIRRTEPDLRVLGLDNVWALGDCAVATNAFDDKPTSATAQFAMREGAHLARNLSLAMSGSPIKAFSFRSQDPLASIGRQNGVAEIYSFRFSARLAWFLWRGVYLFKMPGLGMKIGAALDWLIDAFFPSSIAQLRAFQRFASRGQERFADKLLSAMRLQFGGRKEGKA